MRAEYLKYGFPPKPSEEFISLLLTRSIFTTERAAIKRNCKAASPSLFVHRVTAL
jgi:hypothetical protein